MPPRLSCIAAARAVVAAARAVERAVAAADRASSAPRGGRYYRPLPRGGGGGGGGPSRGRARRGGGGRHGEGPEVEEDGRNLHELRGLQSARAHAGEESTVVARQ